MKTVKRYLRILPTAIPGLAVIFALVHRADSEFVFDGPLIGGLLLVFLVAMMWTNVKDNKEFKETKSKSSYLPTSTAFLFLVSIAGTNYVLKAKDFSPILIQAGNSGGFNASWFEFREDGTYKFGNSSGIGADYYRGKYIINDSLITLDTDNIHKFIEYNRLLILTDHSYIGAMKILVQLNDKNEPIFNESRFRVNVDNRIRKNLPKLNDLQ